MILDSSLKVCFVMLEKILIFVMYYILTAGRLADYRQVFFIPVISIRRFHLPCGVLMHPLPSGVVQRVRWNRFSFYFNKDLIYESIDSR